MGLGKKIMSFFGIVDEGGDDSYQEERRENTRQNTPPRGQSQRRESEYRQTSDRAYSTARPSARSERERDVDEGYERYSTQQQRKTEQREETYEDAYRNQRPKARQPQRNDAPRAARRPAGYAQTVVRTMHRPSDSCEIIEQLVRNNTIVLNLGELDQYNRQRVFDTLYGACYALHAKIQQTSEVTFLLVPQSVALDNGEREAADN